MQTVLPTEIKTVNQAKAFLAALYFNGESYDPADDANDILFVGEQPTTRLKIPGRYPQRTSRLHSLTLTKELTSK